MSKKFWSNKILVFAYVLIILGISALIIKSLFNLKNQPQYDSGIENNIATYNSYNTVEKENEEPIVNYVGYLKIPKINLEQGLVDKNSRLNYVDLNIQTIKESDMPNVSGGNLILAAHSGNSNVSYFTDLDRLNMEDEIYVIYDNKQYEYRVKNYYAVEKTGLVDIVRNPLLTTLTLITCVENTSKQLVVICELIKIDNL